MLPNSRPAQAHQLSPGDHICVRRARGLYAHHGVYVGEGSVIHYTDAAGLMQKSAACIVETTLEEFLGDGELRLVAHRRRAEAQETVSRARHLLSLAGYSLAWNNCEHFATYCATGKKKSRQVQRAVAAVASFAFMAVGSTLLRRRPPSL